MTKFTLAVTTAALVAGGCAAHATDIEFWYGNTGTGETAIQNACAAFNAPQNKDHVTCVGQGSYEVGMQKAIAAYRAGKSPVLIQFFDAGTLDLMLSDAVVPVSDAMPDVDWSQYINGARSYYETGDGRLFSQPYNSSTLLFYTNKSLLEKAGIDRAPATYEELAADAKKLQAAGVDCAYTTDGHPWRILEQFAARHGVPIASEHNGYDGLDAEYVFNQGLIEQHMENLKTWRDAGWLKLSADTKAGSYTDAFNSGECAMMEGSSGSFTAAYQTLGNDVQVSLAPMYKGYERHNTLVGGASLWLMKGHSDAKIQAAKSFLNFVREPEQQLALTETTGYVPVTTAALDYLKQSGKISDPKFGTSAIGIESMNEPASADSRGIRLGFYVQFRDIFMEETQKAFTGGQSMQAALDTAKARGDALLRRFEDTYKGAALP